MPASADPTLVLHSSWRGILGAFSSVILLAALSAVAWGGGATVISVGLTVVAVVVLAIVVLDYPIATEFGPVGVVRRCLLRRQRLAWTAIDALSRTADRATLEPGPPASSGSRARPRGSLGGRPAGLVAVVGRRRYLLVNQSESRDECETLRRLLGDWDVPTRWRAGLPTEAQPPTWLYRRRRWRP